MKKKLYLYIALLFGFLGFAQQISSSIDSTQIKIGSQFNLTIKAKVNAKDKVVFNFSKANQPVYFVEPGETFWVETDDCYSGQIKTETVLRPDIDISIMDCSVGPIAVSGAEPGDAMRRRGAGECSPHPRG